MQFATNQSINQSKNKQIIKSIIYIDQLLINYWLINYYLDFSLNSYQNPRGNSGQYVLLLHLTYYC